MILVFWQEDWTQLVQMVNWFVVYEITEQIQRQVVL